MKMFGDLEKGGEPINEETICLALKILYRGLVLPERAPRGLEESEKFLEEAISVGKVAEAMCE